jgi:hypothetical protein
MTADPLVKHRYRHQGHLIDILPEMFACMVCMPELPAIVG